MPETLLAEALCKSYPTRSGDLSVLHDASLTLDAGASAVVMGPSGSGKSTLLNILGTLEPPGAGRVTIDGVDPFALPQRRLARFRNRRIGFIFQEHFLLPQCSVLENVLIPTLVSNERDRGVDPLERAHTLLDRVGLVDRLDHRPAELSGGERQRVAIARALINQPVLLLADEPTGNLDRHTADDVADLLLEIHRSERTVLIVVTHSERFALRFTGKTCLQGGRWELADGKLVRA